MSPRYSQSAGDRRPADSPSAEEEGRSFTTGIGSMVGPEDEETVPPPPPPPPGPPQPTFTARPDGPAAPVPEPALAPDGAAESDDTLPDAPANGLDDPAESDRTMPDAPALGPDDGAPAEPGDALGGDPVPPADPVPGDDLAAADGDRPQAHPLPTTAGLDEPLLSDADGLRSRWQRVQAGFVDDPQEAVGEAADLIEQTAQAMVGALRQRQRQLRVMWEGGRAGGPVPPESAARDGASAPGARGQDTEHLRQMMRHYRTLFNQLCKP
jgi:hypothetical protein